MTKHLYNRRHTLRINPTFHVCKALGRAFTQRQWSAYLKEHEFDRSETVAVVNGYRYNICDVCQNPTVELRIENKKDYLEVLYAIAQDGRFLGGYHWQIHDEGCWSGVGYSDVGHFDSKNDLVTSCLEKYERRVKEKIEYLKRSRPCDDDGNEVSNTPSIQSCMNMLKALKEKKDFYNPKQLSLFEL